MDLCTPSPDTKLQALVPPNSHKAHNATVFDFPGTGDLQRCGCHLHPGGVGIIGPAPKDTVLEGDEGDLQAPGLTR